jgi:hypothetical protein
MASIPPANSATDAVALVPGTEGIQLSGSAGPLNSPQVQQIAQMTGRMFGGQVEIALVSDPDATSAGWVEFACMVPGSYADYRQRKSQWYDEVARVVPGATTEFRLCLTATHDG